MSKHFEPIDASSFAAIDAATAPDPGPAPMLRWIKIADLVVDRRYQREIGRKGHTNVAKIIANFRWTRFAPVVVAPVEGGKFAIVDGQHRTTAAAARGHEEVPCLVILADMREQADAFSAINSVVTAMSPIQIHAAKVAAGDKAATELVSACRDADVSICRYPLPASKMKVGETLAASALADLLRRFGRPTLVLALKCITRTRDGNPGMVRAAAVKALCGVIDGEPVLLRREASLFDALSSFDFAAEFDAAGIRAKKQRSDVATAFATAVYSHIETRLRLAA